METLQDMVEAFGAGRLAAVARELTKLHETIYRGTLDALLQIGREDTNFARGEITLVVAGHPAGIEAPDDAFARRVLNVLSGELPPSRAAAVVAQLTGRRKAEIYALVQERGEDA
jgi:16S rRNA (cytidine1402-2'-O)-methyltransferase